MRSLMLSFLALVSLPIAAYAQPQGLSPIPREPTLSEMPILKNFPGVTPEQMKLMMERATRVQNCLKDEGKGPLERLKQRSEATSKEVGALCNAGKYKEAQEYAIAQAQEVAESEDLRIIEKCKKDAVPPDPELAAASGQTPDPLTQVPENVCGAETPEQ